MEAQRASADAAEERVSPHLWGAAFVGSLVVHLATGAALAPLLNTDHSHRPATTITFAGPAAQDAAFAPSVVQAPVENSAAVAPRPPAEPLALPAADRPLPAESAPTLAPSLSEASARLPPATETAANLAAVRETALTTPQAAVASAETLLARRTDQQASAGSDPDARLAALADAPLSALAAPATGNVLPPIAQGKTSLTPAREAPETLASSAPANGAAGVTAAETAPRVPARSSSQPVAPAQTRPAVLTAAAPAPQAIALASRVPGNTGSAISPAERTAPLPRLSATGGTSGATLTGTSIGGQTEAPGSDQAPSQVATLAPNPPATPLNPWEQAKSFARSYAGGPCFAVMPAEAAGSVGLEGFGLGEAAGQRFAQAARALGETPRLAFSGLSEAQCEALDFFQSASASSDFPLAIRIDTPRVRDHGVVRGEILRPTGRPVWLVLIDDEGRVGTIGRMAPADPDGHVRFPVNLTAGRVATRQLLMAISSDAIPGEDWSRQRVPATDFFSRLRGIMEETGAKADIAIAAFAVEAGEAGE